MTPDPEVEDRIIRAIHDQRLAVEAARLADDPDPVRRAIGSDLLGTLRRIATATDVDHLGSVLAAGAVDVLDVARPEFAQRHEARFRIRRTQARAAIDALAAEGFRPHPEWRHGAERSFLATSEAIRVSRTAEWTTVVRLDLDPPPRRGGRLVTPRPADWDAVDLPTWAWRGYHVVRPLRLAAERAGLRRRDHGALEPFLATPLTLVGPLLDLAGAGPGDVVADLGCGDGRVIVEAARARRCRGIGADHSGDLTAAARRSAHDQGVSDLVDIVTGDATALDLTDVDVVFLFLPVHLAMTMVERLRHRLRSGARIVCHEQARPPVGFPTADHTTAVVAPSAVTVAHLWSV